MEKLPNRERLLKLADHLQSDRLSLDRFGFDTVIFTGACGTLGCALGECPSLWPDLLEARYLGGGIGHGTVALIDDIIELPSAFDTAGIFFDLTRNEVRYLFQPRGGRYPLESKLTGHASPYNVGQQIREFCEFSDKHIVKLREQFDYEN